MNCPFCDHEIELKQSPRGLYGKCDFCRFSGYLPKIKSPRSPSKVEIESPRSKVEIESPRGPSKVEIESAETPEDYTCPVCGRFYKTEGGIKRHFQRVSDEEEIHPTIYKRHNKYFSEGEGT